MHWIGPRRLNKTWFINISECLVRIRYFNEGTGVPYVRGPFPPTPCVGVYGAFCLRRKQEDVMAEPSMFLGVLRSFLHGVCERKRAQGGFTQAGRQAVCGHEVHVGLTWGDPLLKLRKAKSHLGHPAVLPGASTLSWVCPIRVCCRPSANPGHHVSLA